MNIFSEIYGAYYRAVGRLLRLERFGRAEIWDAVEKEAFRDSRLFIEPKIIPDKNGVSAWGLVIGNKDGSFSPVTEYKPPVIMTEFQKRWLKTRLSDLRTKLFLDDTVMGELSERLEKVKPLYNPSVFRYYDVFSDGDNYGDPLYVKHFRAVLNAVKTAEILKIDFVSGRNEHMYGHYLPIKIEYSRKNDKFRVYCFRMRNGRTSGAVLLNIGRMTRVSETGIRLKRDTPEKQDNSAEKIFKSRRCQTPVTVEVYPERNGVERFMMEFAGYEKQAELDPKTGKCTVKLWFDAQDETELLILLLGFGPVIKITAPEDFRRQAAERVERQYRMLFEREKAEE